MLDCFVPESSQSISLQIVALSQYPAWLANQDKLTQQWLSSINHVAKANALAVIPNQQGELNFAIYVVDDDASFWAFSSLPHALPAKHFKLNSDYFKNDIVLQNFALAWGLASYQFKYYKKDAKSLAKLVLDKRFNEKYIYAMLSACYLTQDLINFAPHDMMPEQLAERAEEIAKQHAAEFSQIVGEDLLTHNYPAIYTVGKASINKPRLIDIRYGQKHHYKLTLVGKGVCFDSGGLTIKPLSGMLLMKKDMAGAAHALGLAQIIMELDLPIQLRVLIPAVENAISGDAYRPGDVITTRSGITVEVTNTDAEGRLVLCDALAEAIQDKPNLLIDFSTLTGAQRVALGTEIAGMFCNNNEVAEKILKASIAVQDPIWQLPLHKPYRELMNSQVANIKNSSSSPYAGAITAALFLQDFVPADIPWIHLDFNAWNTMSKLGRPEGPEVITLRALVHFLQQEFADK